MRRTKLGRTGIEVSRICLGTMTWGSQNTEAEGHAQIDMALDRGVDFLDTAEMYPTQPVRAETVGDTEAIIGTWLAKTGRRQDIVLATKICGEGQDAVRDGIGIFPDTLRTAVEESLKRLRTDYIDLYQFHWPNRGSYHFRKNWSYNPARHDVAEERETIAALAETLNDLVAEGKIRAFGLSNDTAWGIMQWLNADAPRVATIQNEYSLLCRHFDTDLAEMCHHEDITLLAYSPIAAGLLSGKYQGGAVPPGSRLSRTPGLGGRMSERVLPTVAAYLDVARRHGLDPVQMSLAFTMTRPAATIPIIGATSLEQLDTCLGAEDVVLDAAVLGDIAKTHKAHPLPF